MNLHRKKATPEQIDQDLRDSRPLPRSTPKPMPKLPTYARDGIVCGRCRAYMRFQTDHDGRCIQLCGCGASYVPLRGREQVVQYDAGDVAAQDRLRKVAQQMEPASKVIFGGKRLGYMNFKRLAED